MRRQRRQKACGPLLTDLPGSWVQQMVNKLSSDSKLALRATCKALLQEVDSTAAGAPLRLQLRNRTPVLGTVHHLGLLVHISVLDSSTASRGALSIKMDHLPPEQLAGCLPRLRSAAMTNSQASLARLLASAAPQLSSVQLAVSSNTPTVMRELAGLRQLHSLELLLSHPAWMKGCMGLGALTRLRQLTVCGRPLDEASKHGIACITCPFWEDNIAVLTQLTSLSVNPWIKAVPGASTSVTYSTLKQLRQLNVPYCSGKAGPNATAAMLQQLGQHCSHLTRLTCGVHDFNWSVSGLQGLTQLRELELHNPFLKEMWGLQPFTAAHLAPLTAATQLSSLTLSTLRLPLLADIMTAAGQPTAAMAAAAAVLGGHQQPGVVAAAAAAAALAQGGPAMELVNAIAVGAVAAAMQAAAAAAGPEANAAVADIAAAMQQQAAAAAQQAAAQLPGHSAAAAAAGSAQQPADVVATAHDMLQAVAAHAADAAHAAGMQAAAAAAAAGGLGAEQAAQAAQAAHALAAAVAPAAAAAAAAGVMLPGGIAAQLGGQQQHAVAHFVGHANPLAAVVAGVGAGPALGFVPVAVVPPPPPPPPPAAAVAAAGAGAAVPAGAAAVAAAAAAGAGLGQHQGHAAIAAAVSAAASAAACELLPQIPYLPSLQRLTVGTTHGRLMSSVSLAALAPNLTCFEDLSEIMHLPPASMDVLAGLSQLELLTVNVDTLQLHARHASLTGLTNVAIGSSGFGSSSSSSSSSQGSSSSRLRRQGSSVAAGLAGLPPLRQALITANGGSSSSSSRAVPQLVPNPSWRVLSKLRCLRLLMLGHIHQALLSGNGNILPRLPGITRLELCSAFGGRPEYAETYTIAEDPLLWQEQSGVEELVVDGGALLGGFLVDAGMARLLKRKLRKLKRLVLCRCPDLTDEHIEGAAKARLAPEIVVKRDCPLVTEAGIVAMSGKYGGVSVELVGVAPGEYEGHRSATYAIDE